MRLPFFGSKKDDDEKQPRRNVCIFVDDSQTSEEAFRWALGHGVDKRKDNIHLVSIVTPPPLAAVDVGENPVAEPCEKLSPELIEEATKTYKEVHERLKKVAAKEGSHHVEQHVITSPEPGHAGPLAVQFAKEHNADLAVFGSRGMGFARKALMSTLGLGSVSSYAVGHMQCPTVVCPPAGGAASPKKRIAGKASD